jgi:cytochrome c oxidase cbb3-type subunit 2
LEKIMKIAALSLIGLLFWTELVFTLKSAGAAEITTIASRQTLYLGQQVYQVNCAVCHGVGGDGNGPSASSFRIRPRDFRPGIFKFSSTPSGSLPTDGDLLRTVTQGLRWTAMIGRADLGENERRAVIQYIKTFSSRFNKEKPGKPITVPPAPAKTPQLLQQGKLLYADAGCSDCHGTEGRGDGPSSKELKDDWGWPIRPTNLTWQPLKRGSDSTEQYRTVVTGISGTPMPAFGDSLSSQQVWALVYYVESLVPPDHRLNPDQLLGEEQQGWMAVRMGGMMGRGMMRR